MRTLTVWMSGALDGFVEGPTRELDWHAVDDEPHQHFNDERGERAR
jgi:hypothetical protein